MLIELGTFANDYDSAYGVVVLPELIDLVVNAKSDVTTLLVKIDDVLANYDNELGLPVVDRIALKYMVEIAEKYLPIIQEDYRKDAAIKAQQKLKFDVEALIKASGIDCDVYFTFK